MINRISLNKNQMNHLHNSSHNSPFGTIFQYPTRYILTIPQSLPPLAPFSHRNTNKRLRPPPTPTTQRAFQRRRHMNRHASHSPNPSRQITLAPFCHRPRFGNIRTTSDEPGKLGVATVGLSALELSREGAKTKSRQARYSNSVKVSLGAVGAIGR